MRPPVAIVGAQPQHARYITSSWLRGLWRSQKGLSWAQGKRLYQPLIEGVISHDSTRGYVAVGQDGDYIYGWLVISDVGIPVVHWMHVRKDWWGFGIARLLCEHAGLSEESRLLYTGRNKAGLALAKKVKQAEYLPMEDFLK